MRLSFVLSAPARVTLLLFGPGQGCSLAGWITIGGHRGLNHVLLRGRVQKHQLQPGSYRLVLRAKRSAGVESLPTIGILVDRLGVRPATRLAWPNCDRPAAPSTGSGLTPKARIAIAGVSRLEPPAPSRRDSAARAQPGDPSRRATFLPGLGGRPLLGTFLLTLLGLSALLLTLASIRPSYALARYRPVRELASHRPQIALLGCGLFLAAAALFLADRLQG